MKATKVPAQQLLAENAAQPTMEELGEIAKLAKEAALIEERIEKGEKLLAKLKENLNGILQKSLPDLLGRFNLTEIKTVDGFKVSVKPFYSGKIINDSAYDWLVDNGHAGVVKTEITMAFGKGAYDRAKECLKLVDEAVKAKFPGLPTTEVPSLSRDVHYQTLRALVREIMEDGKTLPESKFEVYSGRVATISQA